MSFTLEIKTSVDGSLPDAWKLVFYKRHTQCSCYNSFGGSLKSKCFHSKQNLLQKFCWQEKSCFSSKGSPPSHNTLHTRWDSLFRGLGRVANCFNYDICSSDFPGCLHHLGKPLLWEVTEPNSQNTELQLVKKLHFCLYFPTNKSALLILLSFPSLQSRVHVHSSETFQRK